MWKGEDPSEAFILFDTMAHAHEIREDLRKFNVSLEITACASREGDKWGDVRVLWVPLHVKDELLIKLFSDRGLKVVESSWEKDSDDELFNGAHSFRLIGEARAWDYIPHIVKFCKLGFQALLQVQGREPVCFKCKQVGRQRWQCPQGPRRQWQQGGNFFNSGRGWERRQGRRQDDQDQDSDSEYGDHAAQQGDASGGQDQQEHQDSADFPDVPERQDDLEAVGGETVVVKAGGGARSKELQKQQRREQQEQPKQQPTK
jgi:hypothetical protein